MTIVVIALLLRHHMGIFCSNGAWGKLGQPAQLGCGSTVIPPRGPAVLLAPRRGKISWWSSRTREVQQAIWEEEQTAKLSGAH